MTDIFKKIDGYKTIIVGAAMIITGLYNGDNNLILQGFGLITLRLGIGKIELPKNPEEEENDENAININRR